MIARINAKVEKMVREAMSHVARAEANQIEPTLATLDDEQRREALALAMAVALYVMIDVCKAQWPDDASVRQIADGLATTGTTAELLQLDGIEIYTYLSGAVLRSQPPAEIIGDKREAIRLPIIVAQRAANVFAPKGMSTWDYLDQIETAIETASALDVAVLPAAVMRAYLPKPTSSS